MTHFEAEDLIKKLIGSLSESVPITLKLSKPFFISGLSKKPIQEILGSFSIGTNSGRVKFEIKPQAKNYFYLNFLPDGMIEDAVVHPDYIAPSSNNVEGSPIFKNSIDFENNLIAVLEKEIKTQILFRFNEFVYIPQFSLVPLRDFKIWCKIQTLSKTEKPIVWKDFVCLYTKAGDRTFYWSSILPFTKCVGIDANPEEYSYISIEPSSKSGKKKLELKDRTKETPILPEGQLELYLILKKSGHNAKQRDASHCMICGKPLSRIKSSFIHLLSNGNIVNSPKQFDYNLEFGFFPIGPDCKRFVSPEFVFDIQTIKESFNVAVKEDQTILAATEDSVEYQNLP